MQAVDDHEFMAVGRLQPGTPQEQAAAELTTITRRIHDQHLENPFVSKAANVRPLLDSIVGDMKMPLYVLLAATGCVLLIACLNVANLLVAVRRAAEGARHPHRARRKPRGIAAPASHREFSSGGYRWDSRLVTGQRCAAMVCADAPRPHPRRSHSHGWRGRGVHRWADRSLRHVRRPDFLIFQPAWSGAGFAAGVVALAQCGARSHPPAPGIAVARSRTDGGTADRRGIVLEELCQAAFRRPGLSHAERADHEVQLAKGSL